MHFLPDLALLTIAALPWPLAPGVDDAQRRSAPVLVRSVVDGDTIDVQTFGRVRLLGIDAPEIGRGFDTPAPFAVRARDRLRALIANRWVRLEADGPLRDAYDRHLAYVFREDGLFVNAELLKDGLARISARLPLFRLEELRAAEREAQAFRRGMWGESPDRPSTRYTRPSKGIRVPSRKPRKTASRPRTRTERTEH